MLRIRTSKGNTIIKKPSSALFLWLHNSKGWFVGNSYLIALRQSCPSPGHKLEFPSAAADFDIFSEVRCWSYEYSAMPIRGR
jgi:hypothetical protein